MQKIHSLRAIRTDAEIHTLISFLFKNKVSCWHSTTAYFFEPPCRQYFS